MSTKTILNTSIQTMIWCIMMMTVGCTQSPPEEMAVTPTIYDGCCGTEPKTYEVEDYKVYIPNVITPNGDGINDAFYPICNKMIHDKFLISNYRIYNDTGQMIFALLGLSVDEIENYAFKGKGYQRPYKPQEHEKIIYSGKFTYKCTLIITKADSSYHYIDVEGEGCVVRCDADAHIIKDKDGCYFPVQGLNGVYDASLPWQEDNCIK